MLGLADTSTLSRWECGITIPNLVQVFRLARIYRIQPHDLYEELWHRIGEEFSLLVQDDEPFSSNELLYV